MRRLIYDGSQDQKDTILYTFITENLEDAKEIFYEYYEEDLEDYINYQGLDNYGEVKGLTVYLEINKETNNLEQATIGIQFETDNEDLLEEECNEIEIDEDIVELLLTKVDD